MLNVNFNFRLLNYTRIYAELGDALLEPILTTPGEVSEHNKAAMCGCKVSD